MDSLKAALSTALAEALAESGLNEAISEPVSESVNKLSHPVAAVPANLIPQALQESPVSDVVVTPGVQTPLSVVQTRYMTEHATCAMCDSHLEIRHDANRKDLKVKEEAHCPSCGIRVRSSHHLMH